MSLLINILRNLLLLKIKDWKWVESKLTLTGVIVLLLIMTIYTWAGWISLLPKGASNAKKTGIEKVVGLPVSLPDLFNRRIENFASFQSDSLLQLNRF